MSGLEMAMLSMGGLGAIAALMVLGVLWVVQALVCSDDGNEVWVERPLTKTEAMRLIGNSVPKRMAMLLAQWNVRRALGPVAEAAE